MLYENKPRMFCLSSISTNKGNEPIPCFGIKVEQNTKYAYCIAIENYIIYKTIFQWHGFQP